MRRWQDQLNPAQREVVETLSKPILVLAGAGTGKTRVITYRIARLISAGVSPERILAVTFTNKAAAEMAKRVAELLGSAHRRCPRPEVSTFHAYGLRVLRRHSARLGYPPQFSIYDRADQLEVARAALREVKATEAALRPEELIGWVSRWKSRGMDPQATADSAQTDKESLAAAAYRRYQQLLRLRGAVDFDDLLFLVEKLFSLHSELREEEAARFEHLLIDEYQDTNRSQYTIARMLAEKHRNLCVVGDDDQSIYSWRGAEPEHILRFHRDWPDAKIVRLENNYRSRQPILDWANRLVATNRHRYPKQLRGHDGGVSPRILQAHDEDHEAELVVKEIAARVRQQKIRPRDVAILVRTNDQMRPFELHLRRQKLPYWLVGGQSFYDRKEIRDLAAYLKVILNPRNDVALLRILNTPPRGIGPQTVERLLHQAVQRLCPVWEVLEDGAAEKLFGQGALEALTQFRQLILGFQHDLPRRRLDDLLRRLVDEIQYRREVERCYTSAEERERRWQTVQEFVESAGSYCRNIPEATPAGFLQELTLTSYDDDSDPQSRLDQEAVVLMTLHAAKGLEFPIVYLVGLEEGLLPHRKALELQTDQAIEEERRLCYVGMTRAQEQLILSFAVARHKRGKLVETIPSRFLYEAAGKTDHPGYQEAICGISRRAAQLARSKAARRRKTRSSAKKASAKHPKRRRSQP